jgi:protein transport protein SEC23
MISIVTGIAERCVRNNHAVDLFAMSLDQVGLLEMQCCIQSTGGLCVLGDRCVVTILSPSPLTLSSFVL